MKNVDQLSAGSQIRDYLAFAKAQTPQLDFQIRIADRTKLSGPLRELIADPSNRMTVTRLDGTPIDPGRVTP